MLQDNRLRGQDSHGEDDEIDVFALLGSLWRGRWTLLFCAVLMGVIGGYYAMRVAVPMYTASTSLALELRSEPIVDIEALVGGASTEDAAMNTEVEVIRSRGLLVQLVREMDLTEDPEFNAALRTEPVFSIGAVIGSVRDMLPDFDFFQSDAVTAEPNASSAERDTLNRTVGAVRRAISANVQRDTYIFNINVTTTSADKSQEIANTLADIYILDQIDQKFSATENAVTWLSERVAELEVELNNREAELKSIRTEIDLVSIEALEALNRQLIDTRERLGAAEADLSISQARSNRIEELRSAGNIDELAEFLNSGSLSALLSGNGNPSQAELDARINPVVVRLQADISRQEQQVAALRSSVDRLEQQVSSQSDDLVRLQQAEREVQATRTLYETFLTRLKEATVQRGLQQADSRVLSEAIPGRYVSPQKSRIVLVSVMLGLALGAALVFMRQFMNKGYRTADDLEAGTALPVFGQIPKMPIKRRSHLITYLNDKPASAAAEAVRNLRTSILLASPNQAPQVIMSTSSLPGEGKTTQAICLAHNFAGLNKKVLLIEGDVRRRTLNEYFKVESNKPGIVTALGRESGDISDLVVRDPRMNVDVLLGEKSTLNAADLFSTGKFDEFLDRMRDAYDFIIVDTPPVLIVPEARVIGQSVDAIIFSVAWDRTSRLQLKESLRQLDRAKLDVAGLVLAQIDPAGMKRYGYGGKYGTYSTYSSSYYDQ